MQLLKVLSGDLSLSNEVEAGLSRNSNQSSKAISVDAGVNITCLSRIVKET